MRLFLLSFSTAFACVFSTPFFLSATSAQAEHENAGVRWLNYSEDIFKRAADEKKLILIDLEAIWCHWCHVMDKETYSKKSIQEILAKNFLTVKVDQDSRPDLSTRYQDYGWPATIILSAKGEDLVKRAGFMPEDEMKEMLLDVVANPVPHADKEESEAAELGSSEGRLSGEMRNKLIENHEYFYDLEKGGLDFAQRFLNSDSVEYVVTEAAKGKEKEISFARKTLTSSLKLIDPAWGGAYQYSTDRDWEHPHFEKIMPTQAIFLRSLSLGYGQFKDPAYLAGAMKIYSYLKNFMRSPDGAFYTSQDADLVRGQHSADYFQLDDTARRKRGIPQIDKHIYSYENGVIIQALSALYAASGDPAVLEDAKTAAQWALSNRALPEGGFRHDEVDAGGPYLRDSLAMAQGLLTLYSVSAERKFLDSAIAAGTFIDKTFSQEGESGYFSFAPKNAGILKPSRLQEENIPSARFFNKLKHYTGQERFEVSARRAFDWLKIPKVALRYKVEPGLLLVDSELATPPLHLTVVGAKQDPQALELFKAALSYPANYKRSEWWDKSEGPMPNLDVQYPALDKAAAFVCTQKRCSLPIFAPEGITKVLAIKSKAAT